MSLDNLKALRKSRVCCFEYGASTYHARKMSAGDFAALNTMNRGKDASIADNVEFQAMVLSKCLCDEDGNKTCDSDEGLTELKALAIDDLGELSDKVAEWALPAAADAKKNSPTTSNSPTASVSPAPCDSPPLTNCLST